LNYNEEAAYYGVASSNRPELMLPYIHLILHEANWQENKTHTAGYEGICHQRSMTPYDLIASEPAIIPIAAMKNYKKLPADQKSNGAFAAMPLIWYYEYTRDTAYLRTKLYPYLKKLEAFYDDYMDKSSKPYHIRHSSAHEGSDDMDPNLDIGFCRRLCTLLIRESRTLHTDSAMRKIWQDDLDHLATYPTMMRNGEQVYTESATKNGSTDPDKLFHAGDQPINLEGGVFPGENIHIGGDSISLQIARNSLAQVGGWCVNRGGSENNGFPKVWPIAARIGWPANDLIKKLKAAILFHWRASNLTAFQGGGGIETAGAIEGINSMLMQSEGSIIRVFPDWPLTKNASFTKLRAKGAFLVSSELKNGEVPYIHIQSEQGGMVTLMDPWQDGTVKVFEINGKAKKAISFKELKNNISFNTIKGQSYFISNNGRKIRVNNTDDISEAMQSAKPGDTLVMQNGIWKDQKIVFEGNGTENNPIVLMAETPGSVILSGTSSLNMAGHWLEANGLVFRSGYIQKGSIVNFKNGKDSAYHCRLTNTVIEQYKASNDTIETHWISLYGTHNRVDHCQLSGKSNEGTTLVVWLNGIPDYHEIDHNHFGPRPPLGRNGGEIIRVGTSTWSMTNSYTTVEDNYFEKCDGEIEVISNKSCHNIYRHNTFYACQGTLTLRHGNDVLVENNFFFGNNETESGGVRIIGAHHTVIHNYFQDLSGTGLRAAISVMNAQQHPALNGYWPVKDVTIADNVIVSCKQGLVMGSGAGERGRVVAPVDCHIDDNKIFNEASQEALSGVAVQPVTKADTGPEWIVH
jgi:poly(beta-D-mannuronate) lyase